MEFQILISHVTKSVYYYKLLSEGIVCLCDLVSRSWFPLLGELLCTCNTWGIADVLAISCKPSWCVWNICLSSVSLFDVVCYIGGGNPQKHT